MKVLEHPVFPKPVVTFKAEDTFNEELKYIKNITHIQKGNKMQGSISKNKYLLYEPELKNLKNFFQGCLNFYMKNMFKSKQRVVISQSWSTIINKGEGFDLHDHPNSLINGCFYFNKTPHSSPLELINGRKNFLYVDTTGPTKYNQDSYYIDPEDMELVLFPNNLNHRVPISDSNKTRRSLAFNTTVIDIIGNESRMTQIDIDKIKKNN
mgnify:FL=1